MTEKETSIPFPLRAGVVSYNGILAFCTITSLHLRKGPLCSSTLNKLLSGFVSKPNGPIPLRFHNALVLAFFLLPSLWSVYLTLESLLIPFNPLGKLDK